MEQEKTNTPEPIRASVTLHGGLVGSISATAQLGPVPKPPRPPFLDRNLKAGKFVLKEGARLAAKWCAEPSVHGGKGHPKNAGLVV